MRVVEHHPYLLTGRRLWYYKVTRKKNSVVRKLQLQNPKVYRFFKSEHTNPTRFMIHIIHRSLPDWRNWRTIMYLPSSTNCQRNRSVQPTFTK